ncbi:Tn3 family transposase [Micromonospora arborensis]|uniref:Tn3 family transposase n=1 Tax=Micromonospora arborensis TaxID=2116518 RepID=UPI0033D2E02A
MSGRSGVARGPGRTARAKTRSDQHLFALVVWLKAYGRLGYFPDLFEVPLPIVDHIGRHLEFKPEVEPVHDSDRTAERHRDWVRERLGVIYDPPAARALAERVIREAVRFKDEPADLINVALEELVRARLELPGYTTLDLMAATLRTEVNTALFAGIAARMAGPDATELDASLIVDPIRRRSRFDEAKAVAGAATVTGLRERVRHLAGLEAIGPTSFWLDGVPPAKIAHFAGEAQRTDASDLRKYGTAKRQTLVACLFHVAKVSTRDEIVTMLCKRIAAIHKKAREHLDGLREASRAESERLLGTFGEVLAVVREALAPPAEASETGGEPPPAERDPAGPDAVYAKAGRLVLATLEHSGGVDSLSEAHEVVSAYQGNNYLPFVEKFYRGSRAALFDMLDVLEFQAASADQRVLKAVEFLRANRTRTGEHLNITVGERNGRPVELDLSFATENWRKLVVDPRRRARVIRRHFEACVFSYLAAELRTGDIAVAGSEAYANFMEQLLPMEECEPLVAAYCREAGLPADAAGAVAALRARLEQTVARVDTGFPANTDLRIAGGRPVLKPRQGKERRQSALDLEMAIHERLPERGILEILTRTAYLTRWHRHFGPPSGNEPKIRDALGRYVLLTFTYGANLGPAQVARHMSGQVSVHQLHQATKHAEANKIHKGSMDVINAYAELDLSRLYGDGTRAGTDGTQLDTWADNLLAESHIRYGGYGGLAYRYISDTYIALFSHFIPCGVWEAVYILDGLLRNKSDLQPSEIHADTQGQSLPVFGLAHLLGFDLLPRIRNWQDLVFHRPDRAARYEHVDSLFSAEAVDWQLIETHWDDLMRVAVSVRAGRISSVTLLRRLSHESKKNRIYRALREVGRAVRTIVLLRYLSEPELRDSIAAVTNRVEAFHGFANWLSFGREILAHNDPVHQEMIVKFNELMANCAIYSTALDIMVAANELFAAGHPINWEDLATIDLTPPPQGTLVTLDVTPVQATRASA